MANQYYDKKSNIQFIAILKTQGKHDKFTDEGTPIFCDEKMLADKIPESCHEGFLVKLNYNKMSELAEQQKIVFTQKFIYVLAQDVDRELWPFKMPAPTFMKHKMVKQAPEDSKPDKRKHFDLKMMSYNVYADAFMEPTIKGSIAYSNQCSKSFEQIDF